MRRGALVAGVMMLALVTGCSRSPEPQERDETVEQNVAEPVPELVKAPPPVEVPAVREPEPDRNVAEALPPETAPSVDQQMIDDADATGLTSRSAPPDVVTDPAADPVGAPHTNGLDSGASR